MGADCYECICGEQNKWRITNEALECSSCERRYDVQAVMFDVESFNKDREELVFEDSNPKEGGE